MRKSVFCVLVLVLLATAVKAQPFSPFRNGFASVGVGATYYSGVAGLGADVALGKWILSTTALRGVFDVNLSSANGTEMHPYYYGHFDLMVDIYSALRGRNPSDYFRSYLILGGGAVHSSFNDNDFCAVAGIGGDFRISDDWRLFTELSMTVHPSDFDNKMKSSAVFSFKAGVLYDIADNPTRSRSRFETKSFPDDWFFNVALGVCSVNHREIADFNDRISHLTPVFEFGIGKRLTTLWQIRLCASGLYAKANDDFFSFYNLRGDIMIDPVAYFSRDNFNPMFSVVPYLGAGVVARLDSQSDFLVAPTLGMQLLWRADKRNHLYLDGHYVVTPPRFVKSEVVQPVGSVGLFTLMVGYAHIFSRITLD